jgi:hypothetical protein
MPKKLRPAVDLMAFKCRMLKVKGTVMYLRSFIRYIKIRIVICYRGLRFPQRAVVFLPLEIDAACSNLIAHFARKSAVLLEA